MDPDKAFAVQIKHEESVLTGNIAYMQCAVLFSSSNGERRIRCVCLAMLAQYFDIACLGLCCKLYALLAHPVTAWSVIHASGKYSPHWLSPPQRFSSGLCTMSRHHCTIGFCCSRIHAINYSANVVFKHPMPVSAPLHAMLTFS